MRGAVALIGAVAFLILAPAAGAVAASPQPQVVVDPADVRGEISPLIYGANHRYGFDGMGMFDPVAQQVFPAFVRQSKDAGFTIVRYPGGTQGNTFHFQRAIGPQEQRTPNVGGSPLSPTPTSSDYGPDEHGEYIESIGAKADLMLNFGTGSAAEAADFVEYMSAPVGANPNGGTAWAEVRASNGHPAPYDVGYVEIGNEISGGGQGYWLATDGEAVDPRCASVGGSRAVDEVTCHYANGGSQRFTQQRAVGDADWRPSTAVSDGSAGQSFYARSAPVTPGSQTVYVDGTAWEQVGDLATAGREDAYALEPSTGKITFGDGTHGNVPPEGAVVTITYTSGPHDGYNAYYRAIKAVDPSIQVCSGLEIRNANRPRVPLLLHDAPEIDCFVEHSSAQDFDYQDAPIDVYHENFMLESENRTAAVAETQDDIREAAGHDIPVIVTEHGHNRNWAPTGMPEYQASLDEALFTADSLRGWIDIGIPVAEKQALVDLAFHPDPEASKTLSPWNSIISGPGPDTISQGAALVMGQFTHMMGPTHVGSAVLQNPYRMTPTGKRMDDLTTVASKDAQGNLYTIVVNRDQSRDVTARVVPIGHRGSGLASVWTVDGPSYLSYNTPEHPDTVALSKRTVAVSAGAFEHTFPAHSVTAIKLSGRETARPLDVALEAQPGAVPEGRAGAVTLTATVRNAGDDDAAGHLDLQVPDGWSVAPASARYAVGPHAEQALTFRVGVPADAPEGVHDVSAVLFGPGPLAVDTAGAGIFVGDPVEISTSPESLQLLDGTPATFRVGISNAWERPVASHVRIEAPAGWAVTPATRDVSLPAKGDEAQAQFTVTPSPGSIGPATLRVVAEGDWGSVSHDVAGRVGRKVALVGAIDLDQHEFALAGQPLRDYPGAFPDDVDYTVGVDDPARDWSFIQPGPFDGWAASARHTFTVRFGLDAVPERDLAFTAWLLDTRDAASGEPPRLSVALSGGAGREIALPPGGGDGYHWGDAPDDRGGIEPATITMPLPRTSLHTGENTVTITTTAGSWLVYDAFGVHAPAS